MPNITYDGKITISAKARYMTQAELIQERLNLIPHFTKLQATMETQIEEFDATIETLITRQPHIPFPSSITIRHPERTIHIRWHDPNPRVPQDIYLRTNKSVYVTSQVPMSYPTIDQALDRVETYLTSRSMIFLAGGGLPISAATTTALQALPLP